MDNFLDSLSSKHTKTQYQYQLERFTNAKVPMTADGVSYYLAQMKKDGLSYSYRNLAKSAIRHWCDMHDIVLNWRKITKYLGENSYDNTLRGYTHEEIQKLLNVANVKYKAIILTLTSTGMRREALVEIKPDDMEYIDDYQLYKITIYRRTKEQQICFTTPEAATAIDLHFRTGYFHDIQAHTISETMRNLAIKAGIMNVGIENKKRGQYRNEIPCVHGLRKFCSTQMAKTDMKLDVQELLVGHSIGIRTRYAKYSDADLLQEYLKAIDFLTINSENRLLAQVDEYKKQELEINSIKEDLKDLREANEQFIKHALANDLEKIVEKDGTITYKEVDRLVRGSAKKYHEE